MTDRVQLYTFLGGPFSGERIKAVGATEVVLTVQPELTDMLAASVKVMRGELVAVPGPRKAVYRLGDDHAYRFVGWQQ